MNTLEILTDIFSTYSVIIIQIFKFRSATETKKQPQTAATKSSVTWEDSGKKAVKSTVIKVLPNSDQSDATGGNDLKFRARAAVGSFAADGEDDLKSRAKAAVGSADGDGLISTLMESDVPTAVQQNV